MWCPMTVSPGPALASLLILSLAITAGCGNDTTDGVDSDLIGTWQASGTMMTGSMHRSGDFLLRIETDGAYLLLSQGGTDFVIDAGRFSETPDGSYVRKTSTGLEDRGTWEIQGDALHLHSLYGELTARRADPATGEPDLTRLTTLLRIPPRNHISHWVSRAAQYAVLWQPDARLEYVSMLGFDERGLLLPTTSATIAFYSPERDLLLLLSPTATASGAMTMAVVPRGSRPVSPRGIPVPVMDFALLVNRHFDAGQRERYATADLRWFAEGAGPPRLLWLAALEGRGGFDRHCLDAITATVVDCRQHAGDHYAEFAALEERAEAAWATLQQRWAAGDASSGDLSYTPQSDFERCSGRGGSHNGVGCFFSSGEEIRGY